MCKYCSEFIPRHAMLFQKFSHFLFSEETYIYFLIGKYSMYRCNKAFDKNVKECTCILCQNCYDFRLEELEKHKTSQRMNKVEGKNHFQDHLGDLEGPRHEVDICSLELDESFSWVTKKHIEKLEKNDSDLDSNPGKNLVDFFIPEAYHDCKGRIPMIDRLSVKKSNLLCGNESKSKNLVLKFGR